MSAEKAAAERSEVLRIIREEVGRLFTEGLTYEEIVETRAKLREARQRLHAAASSVRDSA